MENLRKVFWFMFLTGVMSLLPPIVFIVIFPQWATTMPLYGILYIVTILLYNIWTGWMSACVATGRKVGFWEFFPFIYLCGFLIEIIDTVLIMVLFLK